MSTPTPPIDPKYGWRPTPHAIAVMKAIRSQDGFVEKGGADGKSGNITPYWDWWEKETGEHLQGEPYCAAGLSWGFAQGGASKLIAATHPAGFVYCPDGVKFFKARKAFLDPHAAHFGDPIFYGWNLDGISDHVETVIYNLHASSGGKENFLVTFGFNTSPQNVQGSQSNGGGAYIRKRPINETMLGVGRPDWASLEKK